MTDSRRLDEVTIAALDPLQFGDLLGPGVEEFLALAKRAAALLDGHTVWNVNSTAAGGGVAEMLQPLLGYTRGAGVDTRWLVIQGDARFFEITKRLHNNLHENPGDGGPLGAEEQDHYRAVLDDHLSELRAQVRAGDVVILHDPQTAGLAEALKAVGAHVVWRCHIGTDEPGALAARGWEFLRPHVDHAHVAVFSRDGYVPDFLRDRSAVIAPSIDPFSAKNEDLDPEAVEAVLLHTGIVRDGRPGPRAVAFTRRDGSPGRVDRVADIIGAGPDPYVDAPLVVQISRWDHLKDMLGVMQAFASVVAPATEAHLALVGPNVTAVADDPEGVAVFNECLDEWRQLPHATRARIQLVCLPMHDREENAVMVNALQRHAAVVVQKSLAEGFGLTVTEAMWKGRPVVASAVGGIQDQIVNGEHGVLLDDPADLQACGEAILGLLQDPERAAELGRNARQRVIDQFLPTRHLTQYTDALAGLLATR